MKASELMLGDLLDVHRSICVADGGRYEQWEEYAKVVGINEDYVTVEYLDRVFEEKEYDREDIEPSDIVPIPLTYEILMKNFPDTESGVTWYWRDTVFEIGIDINEYTINGIFHYVHELQHALRLCGFDKEIEL